MTVVTFDTLAYSKRLQKAGIPAEQADTVAETQKRAMDEVFPARELVTKSNLAKTKNELIKCMMGMFLAQTAIIVAVIGAVMVAR